jgi:hypothetical protein
MAALTTPTFLAATSSLQVKKQKRMYQRPVLYERVAPYLLSAFFDNYATLLVCKIRIRYATWT